MSIYVSTAEKYAFAKLNGNNTFLRLNIRETKRFKYNLKCFKSFKLMHTKRKTSVASSHVFTHFHDSISE